jgi:EAL domain
MVPIGRWVLLEACRQSRAWSDLGLRVVSVAVNVSAAEFEDKDFLSGVRAVLIATGVDLLNLELEMTESALMEDAESTLVTLVALKAMGVQLAIDDFGTGYSSFTYLRRFPVDALKVDQSFVREITANPADSTIVSAIINIGNSVGLRVIAEGVETQAQLGRAHAPAHNKLETEITPRIFKIPDRGKSIFCLTVFKPPSFIRSTLLPRQRAAPSFATFPKFPRGFIIPFNANRFIARVSAAFPNEPPSAHLPKG